MLLQLQELLVQIPQHALFVLRATLAEAATVGLWGPMDVLFVPKAHTLRLEMETHALHALRDISGRLLVPRLRPLHVRCALRGGKVLATAVVLLDVLHVPWATTSRPQATPRVLLALM